MHEQKPKQYNQAIDLLKIISILAVVFIHTTTRTIQVTNYDLVKISWSVFLNQILRFAVPMFFMISGFVLELNFRVNESYLGYIKRRLTRILIPYIFWSAIYYFFVFNNNSTNFFHSLLLGNASYQLYFIPTLLIFY